MVSLRKGPYGIYVQLGEGGKEERPKRASLPKGLAPASVTLESALALLALPRALGVHPDSREPVTAGIGRFGPYLKHGQVYKSLPRDEDVLTIGLNRAVVLLAEEKRRPAAAGEPLGPHPSGVGEITLHDGRYGAYVQHGGVRATLPRGTDAGGLTIAAAVALLDAKAGAAPTKGRGRPSATTAAKRPAARAGAASKTKPKPAGRAKARAKVRAKASDQDPP
jgi:DNA topoisomerase-1